MARYFRLIKLVLIIVVLTSVKSYSQYHFDKLSNEFKKENNVYEKFYFFKKHNVSLGNPVFDLFKINSLNNKANFTFYSFEDYSYIGTPKNRIEELKEGDVLMFILKNDTIKCTYKTAPKIELEEHKKLIVSNVIEISLEDLKRLAKRKIIAIKTKKREYYFKGHLRYKDNKPTNFNYRILPSDFKQSNKSILKLISN